MNTHFNTPNNSLVNSAAVNHPKRSDNDQHHANNGNKQNAIALLEKDISKQLPGVKSISNLNPADFTPAAVSDRIVNFVTNAIAQRATSELEAQSLLQQAKEGIMQGIAEARSTLDSLSQMSDDISEQIDETQALIFTGLDNARIAPIETTHQQKLGQLISESATQSTYFKQSSQSSIEITTQDGDKIRVKYSAFIETASNQQYLKNNKGEFESAEYMSSASTAFKFDVKGNIDAGEQKAINELLNDIGDLSNQFFNGDVQAAFNSAMELGFNSNELKGFALDFKQTTYAEVTQTYQRTERITEIPQALNASQPEYKQNRDTNHGLAPAIDVLSQLNELIEQARESALIQQPENTLKAMLNDMLDLLNQEFDSTAQDYIKQAIQIM